MGCRPVCREGQVSRHRGVISNAGPGQVFRDLFESSGNGTSAAPGLRNPEIMLLVLHDTSVGSKAHGLRPIGRPPEGE